MKLSVIASQRASHHATMEQVGAYDRAFTKYPELLLPEFWNFLMAHAVDPQSAQEVVGTLCGVLKSKERFAPNIVANIFEVLNTARETVKLEAAKQAGAKFH